jgi:flagellar basal-body rod protein FlgB
VEPIHLFELAAKQARWLSTSQSAIANNVSNANTPGFKAQTVQPFTEVLDRTQLQMASTSPSHISPTPADQQAASLRDEQPWETSDSGNTVSLEQEMISAGEVNRGFALNTNLVKAFHGLLMSSVRT